VEAPSGFRAIGDYQVGDQVLTASRSGDSWVWKPDVVQYSNGSPATADPSPTAGNVMLLVEYGDGKQLIASPNQLFTLADGKLKRADQLAPGHDRLAGRDGGTVQIGRITSGYYKGEVHHIATEMVAYGDFDGSLDGHLINANGVVAGDYLLQIYQDTNKLKPYIESSAPAMGTPAYANRYPDLVVKPYVVGPGLEVVGAEIAAPEFFTAHGQRSIPVPVGALALFTERQEALLLDPDMPRRGFTDATNRQQVAYFAKLFGAFYPDVEIVLDWDSAHPNVFGYQADGKPGVLIGGELLRLGPLYGPAMALAISFGVAAATTDPSSPGRAVYDGVAGLLRTVLEPYWAETVQDGQGQFAPLLAALARKEADLQPEEGGLGARCLAEVIDAAVSGLDMPGCAGGDTLALLGAAYADGVVTARFSTELNPETGDQPANYAVSPDGVITGAYVDSKDLTTVNIACDLAAGSYVLTVQDLTAADGSTLNPLRRSAPFKVS
jgi:hypothetical protein